MPSVTFPHLHCHQPDPRTDPDPDMNCTTVISSRGRHLDSSHSHVVVGFRLPLGLRLSCSRNLQGRKLLLAVLHRRERACALTTRCLQQLGASAYGSVRGV